jgi:hypothetical protein
MRASRAKVVGLHETATTVGTDEPASARACASAPWRGGSKTTVPKDLSSGATNGCRNRSRATATTGFSPSVVSAARLSAAMASLSLSAAVTRARSASLSANGPTPANRSAMLSFDSQFSATRRANVASPAAVGCRKFPGGSATRARPITRVGEERCAINSPCRVRRAIPWRAATSARLLARGASSGPEPRTSISRPASVAVAWMSSGLPGIRPCASSASAIAQAASMACASPGAKIGQRSIATSSCARRLANPTLSTPRVARRACSTARRRPSPWASIRSSTGVSSPACASASTTNARFHAR